MRLSFVKLTKKFSSRRGLITAVDELDLEIRAKEFFVLLGPSGCGKSTVLNLIAGLENPSQGEIWFGPRLVASAGKKISLTPRERNIAFVFQSYALYPHLNVFENIAFPLKAAGEDLEKIRRMVKEVSLKLNISDLLLARPRELSGGQRQRVAIARAIVRRPYVFLLDEPLSNLDAQLRASTRDELKTLQRSLGITTVYVTHDQVEAMTLGDRVAVLKNGRLEQLGTPEELYEKPANVFVAGFIGFPPMNIFKIKIFQEGESFYINIGDIKLKVPEEKIEDFKKLKDGSGLGGLRPEDIYLNPGKDLQPLVGKIELRESLGRENFIHISAGSFKFTALTTAKALQEGEKVRVGFELKKLHIFEE